MATALRIGSGAAEWLPGHPEPWAGTDGSRDPARGSGRTGAGITLAMVVAGTLAVSVVTGNRGNLGDSGDGPPSAGGGRGSIQRDGVGTGAIQATDSRQEQQKMFGRLTGVAAATAVGVSTTIAGAQATAVQWRVEDGGNGHWYSVGPNTRQHVDAAAWAASLGGALVSLETQAEQLWVLTLDRFPTGNQGAWIGMAETPSGWFWNTGVEVSGNVWLPGNPCEPCDEPVGMLFRDSMWGTGLADSTLVHCCEPYAGPIAEWSADCNADGIVDYGQCRDGSLPDYDGNNVPDCCENGQSCAVGNYPVQWRVDDGGNGHWYRMTSDRLVTWIQARADSMLHGGELASIGSSEENEIVFRIGRSAWIAGWAGPWIGGMRTATGWEWSDGSLWEYTAWDCANPSNSGGYEDRVHYAINGSCSALPIATWNDAFSGGIGSGGLAFITEWSADCNNDGIVDYGQILLGQLSDLNANGIPDTCEASCSSVDLDSSGTIDGADLGTLLANWGVVAAGTPADIDGDGTVGGADLGLLLSFWGPCAP